MNPYIDCVREKMPVTCSQGANIMGENNEETDIYGLRGSEESSGSKTFSC